MPCHYVIGDGEELPIGAIRTLDPRFLAKSANPFIRAGWRIPRSTRFPTLKAARINIVSAAEEGTEKGDLFLRSRTLSD
jgi:hypothetical protein